MSASAIFAAFGDRRYQVARAWGTMPDHPTLGALSKAAVDSEGYLYICQRIEPPIIGRAADGRYARRFGEGQVADSHDIFVSDDDQALVVDRDAHQVLGFDKLGACKPVPLTPYGVAGDRVGNLYCVESSLTSFTRLAPI